MKKSKKPPLSKRVCNGMMFGIFFGFFLGIVFGLAVNNLLLGIAVGPGFGLPLGVVLATVVKGHHHLSSHCEKRLSVMKMLALAFALSSGFAIYSTFLV
jgi:hypothetical protein